MSRQTFNTLDVLALEVGVRPSATNLLKNPSGLLGAWGWITPVAGNTVAGAYLEGTNAETISGTSKLVFSTGGPAGIAAYLTSEPEPVAAGQYVQGSLRLAATITAGNARAGEISIVFYNAAGAQISRAGTGQIPNGSAAHSAHFTTVAQAPAGTARAALRLDALAGTSGARVIEFRDATLYAAATAAAVTFLPPSPPYAYTNILGKSHEITVERAGLSLGILTAKIRSAALDPSVSATISPGAPVRLMARGADGFGAFYPETSRFPIFTGEIKSATVTYDHTVRDPDKRTLISLTATDATARLANLKQDLAVRAIGDLRYLLEGCSVPWEINGTTNNVPGAPAVVARNDNATVLDQVALTRDSRLGHAWVSRYGVLKARDANTMPSTAQATLTQADYNADIDIDFDTARCINSVTIKRQALDPADSTKTIETVFGPYADDASVRRWGAFGAEFTVVGLSDAEVASHAATILAANATPARRVNRLTLPIKDARGFALEAGASGLQKRAHLDIYDRVRVTNTRAGLDETLRVSGLKHKITTNAWLVDVEFASTAGSAMPSPAPALPDAKPYVPPPPPVSERYGLGDYSGTLSGAGGSNACEVRVEGKVCHVHLDLVHSAAMPANQRLLVGNPAPQVGVYVFVMDRNTGASVPMYIAADGFICYVFARDSGSGVVGTITYIRG